jgi:hypothetical protein
MALKDQTTDRRHERASHLSQARFAGRRGVVPYLIISRSNATLLALVLIWLCLALMFLGTFVTTLDANKRKIGADGIPPYLKNIARNFIVLGVIAWAIVLNGLMRE